MTSQADMRAGLVTVLQGVAGVSRVYSYPPATVQDVPCAIVVSASIEEQWNASIAVGDWSWRVLVLCRDATQETAFEDAEDYRDTFRLGLRQAIKLGGLANVSVSGPTFDEVQQYQLAGDYVGFEATVPIKVTESVEFAI